MSFPINIPGVNGEEFSTYTDKRHPFGTLMHFLDGRAFRFCQMGATLGARGKLYQASLPVTNHVGLAVAAAATAGAKTVSVTQGATASTLDQYKDGYLFIEDVDGESFAYPIKSHPVVGAAGGTLVVTLETGYPIEIALTTSSIASLVKSKWDSILITPATTLTTQLVGVPIVAIAASSYGWVQTSGPAGVLTAGVVVIGNPAVAPTGVGGAVGPATIAVVAKEHFVGLTMRVGGDTNYSLIDLHL